MDNRQRAINYVRQNRPETSEFAGAIIDHAMEPSLYEKACLDDLLKPGQRRRIKHKRAGVGAHRRAQRKRRQTQLLRRLAHLAAFPGRE